MTLSKEQIRFIKCLALTLVDCHNIRQSPWKLSYSQSKTDHGITVGSLLPYSPPSPTFSFPFFPLPSLSLHFSPTLSIAPSFSILPPLSHFLSFSLYVLFPLCLPSFIPKFPLYSLLTSVLFHLPIFLFNLPHPLPSLLSYFSHSAPSLFPLPFLSSSPLFLLPSIFSSSSLFPTFFFKSPFFSMFPLSFLPSFLTSPLGDLCK